MRFGDAPSSQARKGVAGMARAVPLYGCHFWQKKKRLFFQMAESICKSSPTGNVLGLLLKI